MSKIINKLKAIVKPALKSALEFLFHSILGLLLLAVGGISAVLIFLWDFVLNLLNKKLIPLPEYLTVGRLLLLLLILLSFYFILKVLWKKYFVFKQDTPIKPKKSIKFIPMGGFVWKSEIELGYVNEEPYCPTHKIKLIKEHVGGYAMSGFIYNYFCSDCKGFVRKNINEEDVEVIYQMAVNKVEQLKDNLQI